MLLHFYWCHVIAVNFRRQLPTWHLVYLKYLNWYFDQATSDTIRSYIVITWFPLQNPSDAAGGPEPCNQPLGHIYPGSRPLETHPTPRGAQTRLTPRGAQTHPTPRLKPLPFFQITVSKYSAQRRFARLYGLSCVLLFSFFC